MRRPPLIGALPLAALLLAGCGSAAPPKLDHADAARLIALTGRIAAEGPCAQARDIPTLRARAIALVNAHRVPAALQEPLLSGVNALATPLCLPSVPAAATTTAVTATVPAPHVPAPGRRHPERHQHGPPHHHGHGHGHDR